MIGAFCQSILQYKHQVINLNWVFVISAEYHKGIPSGIHVYVIARIRVVFFILLSYLQILFKRRIGS